MKFRKMLLLGCGALLLTGCGDKEVTNGNGDEPKSYTNKFECVRSDNTSKYMIEKRYGKKYDSLEEEREASKNSEVGVSGEIRKIYDFNKSGDKLLHYYEIATYKYLVDVDMSREEENYKDGCDESSDYGYINCKVSVDGKTITVTKEADLDGDYNKEEAAKMTLESIKNDYSESDIYTCE